MKKSSLADKMTVLLTALVSDKRDAEQLHLVNKFWDGKYFTKRELQFISIFYFEDQVTTYKKEKNEHSISNVSDTQL